jgi:putative transposase
MPIGNVSKKRGKAKQKIGDKRSAVEQRILESYSEGFDIKMSVIQELIPLGLQAVAEALQNEVKCLAGEKYSRGSSHARWGRQNGSVYLRDQKFPIQVPRVRDLGANEEVPLETYRRLQRPFDDGGQVMRKLLHGLSTHKYQESSSLAAEAFGISASSLSKQFKQASADKLKQLQSRSLSGHEIIAIFIDAKRYAKDGIAVALGVTLSGDKLILGIEQIHSENARAIEQWMDRWLERGLRFEEGILFIIDGSKGIDKALRNKFGNYALIQRCQWHKRENVLSYLDKAKQAVFRRRLQDAYGQTTHQRAKKALMRLHKELEPINASAANSLLEGLEETLTIHRLGLATELGRSLSTTNCIESVMSLMGGYTDKVDRWRNSNQLLRWTATALLDIEPRLRKIREFRYLSVLRFKLHALIQDPQKESSTHESSRSHAMDQVEIIDSRAI